MTGTRRKALAWWVLALIVAASSASACSDSKADGKPIAKSSTSSTTSTTTVDPRGTAALQAWEAYVKASAEWFNPPNPGDPRMVDLIASTELQSYRVSVAEQKAQDRATRPNSSGPPKHNAKVDVLGEQSVTLRDCFVDDTVAYNYKTGAVLDDAVSTRQLQIVVVSEAGHWKIKTIKQVSSVPGRTQCAA